MNKILIVSLLALFINQVLFMLIFVITNISITQTSVSASAMGSKALTGCWSYKSGGPCGSAGSKDESKGAVTDTEEHYP